MPDLRSVPDDTKWRIATQYSANLAAIYERVFRPVIKNRYDELEQEIWILMAQFSCETALSLRFPVETARELAECLRSINTLFSGPDYKDEIIEVAEDSAVIIIRRCPVLMNNCNFSAPDNGTFHRCMALTLATQKKMNPKFSSRFVRAMCMGDRQCEIKIEPEREPSTKPVKKIP